MGKDSALVCGREKETEVDSRIEDQPLLDRTAGQAEAGNA